TTPPWAHPGAFLLFAAVTGFMMFNFAYWREQLCIIACPYGRMQSVMLDRQSLIIHYDPKRGEPRGKPRKAKRGQSVPLPVLGDCVDCDQCVQVCPTGIDIRDGLQLECVNCAQCIDACNDVMARFGRDAGLIRYSSQDAMDRKPIRWLRPRVVLYPVAILALFVGLMVTLIGRPAADTIVLGPLGRPFTVVDDGRVNNTLRVKITNRTEAPRTYAFELPAFAGLSLGGASGEVRLEPEATTTENVQVLLDYEDFTAGRLPTQLVVTDDLGNRFPHRVVLQGPTAPPTLAPTPEDPEEPADDSR
ncbi:MAG: 4Fe-4S dicluster domain-containing protein, partial [Planctomycetota bacterium]